MRGGRKIYPKTEACSIVLIFAEKLRKINADKKTLDFANMVTHMLNKGKLWRQDFGEVLL